MKYWKHLEIEGANDLCTRLTAWYKQDLAKVIKDKWTEVSVPGVLGSNPLIARYLKTLKTRCTYAALIMIPSQEAPLIHIDNMPNVKSRLLFPVLNTQGSRTVFYKALKKPVFTSTFDGSKKAWEFQPADVEQVDEFSLLQPSVIRISEPHAVLCDSNVFPRVSLTLRLADDPIWMLE